MGAVKSPGRDSHTPWWPAKAPPSLAPITWTMTSGSFPDLTASTAGLLIAMTARTAPTLPTMFHARQPDMKTSTNTAIGAMWPATAHAGDREQWSWDGRPIASGTGCGFHRGDGRGWKTRLGGLLHFTMAAGHLSRAGGSGFLGPWWCGRFGRQPSLLSWAVARVSNSQSVLAAAPWDGSHWLREKCLCRDTV